MKKDTILSSVLCTSIFFLISCKEPVSPSYNYEHLYTEPKYADVTVSEKVLNDVGCSYVEVTSTDGKKSEELECDEVKTTREIRRREKAYDAYISAIDDAMQTPNLRPSTKNKLFSRKIHLQFSLSLARNERLNSTQNEEFNAMLINDQLLRTNTLIAIHENVLKKEAFGCYYNEEHYFICAQELEIISENGDLPEFKRRVNVLSREYKFLRKIQKLDIEEEVVLVLKYETLDKMLEKIEQLERKQ